LEELPVNTISSEVAGIPEGCQLNGFDQLEFIEPTQVFVAASNSAGLNATRQSEMIKK
jgi:hypothetical protein